LSTTTEHTEETTMSDVNPLRRQPHSNPGDPKPDVGPEPGVDAVPRPGGGTGQVSDLSPGPGLKPWVHPRLRPKRPALVSLGEADRLRKVEPWHDVATPKRVTAARKALNAACDDLAAAQDAYSETHPAERDEQGLRSAQGKAQAARRAYDAAVSESLGDWAQELVGVTLDRRQAAAEAVVQAEDAVASWRHAYEGARAAVRIVTPNGWHVKSPRSSLLKEASDGLKAAAELVTTDDVALSFRCFTDFGEGGSVPEWVPEALLELSGKRHAAQIALGLLEAARLVPTEYTRREEHLYAGHAKRMGPAEIVAAAKDALR
jgi:hypothetical protein